MKQVNLYLNNLEGDKESTTTFIEDSQKIFAQEGRTIDEICNEGDMELIRDFSGYGSDCCHVRNPLETTFFGLKKMKRKI